MAKTTKLDTAEAIYRGQLKEQVKLLRNKGFKPSCVKKIDLRASTKTLEAIFKEGLLTLLNLTEVTVDPDNDVDIYDIYDAGLCPYVISESMESFKTSKLPITKSLWWVIAHMTNPYFMKTLYKQWDPVKKEYIYNPRYFKPLDPVEKNQPNGLPLEKYKVKRINVHSSIYMNTNIDKISVKTSKISDYKGSHQYVTHANGINKRLFAEKLYKLTGVEFDVIHDFKLKSFNSTDASLVDDDNVNYGLNIYAVCSAA